ncbi:MAG TPA: cytochrome P460 family protein, partial [Vicinamibacterales bacterium]|nr:cytochrome P460 family protein [Vicinamibacterales bacterium]
QQGAAPAYTKTGELVMPADYRHWTFVSSSIGMGYPTEGAPPSTAPPMFHNIFVNPDAYASFMTSGTWPDKTVLLMEMRAAGHLPSLNPDARFETGVMGYEIHVKDMSRGGWSFYGIRPGAASGKRIDTQACYTCHDQHGAVDSTFVQYYEPLVDIAKKKGTYKSAE